jgi:uncharacterized protein (UPF0303 family)
VTFDPAALVDRLEEQERRLVFDRFDQDDAWLLGNALAQRAREEKHPLLIDIRRVNLVLFRAALPGTSADQESWAARKAAVVFRMDASSALVAARLAAAAVDPVAVGWLDSTYAVTGGSFPVRVAGAGVVAAVTASGLSSEADHDFIVHGLETYRASQHR